MKINFFRRTEFEKTPMPDPVLLIVALDPDARPLAVPEGTTVVDRLDLAFHDITQPCEGLVHPTVEHAQAIVAFMQRHDRDREHVVVLCEAGVGRSAAIAAAIAKMSQVDPNVIQSVLRQGTYNRLIYQLILAHAGFRVPSDPKASIVVRVKYPLDRLLAFLLSMQRQRWNNWECIVVTDGPHPEARDMLASFGDPRVQCIETPERKGRWGHPWRQMGIDACTGSFIGLQNDDNYLTPGFLEQAIMAMMDEQADLCLVNMLHNYFGYNAVAVQLGAADLGSWLARAALVKMTPWTGDDFLSDNDYIQALAKKAMKVTSVQRFLFVHN